MKIVQYNDNILQLRPRGGWFILLMGALLIVTTPVWLLLFGQTTQLTCERTAAGSPRCRLSKAIFGVALRDDPIEALQGARVAESRDSDGDLMYKLVLDTGAGSVPFTNVSSSSYNPKARRAADINNFVADTSIGSLTVESGGAIGWIVSGVLALMGVSLLFGGMRMSATVWTFDRTQKVVVKERHGLATSRTWQYDLAEIQDALVTESRDSDGDRTYRVELVSHQGERIPMTNWYSSGYRKKEDTVRVIQQFLNRF